MNAEKVRHWEFAIQMGNYILKEIMNSGLDEAIKMRYAFIIIRRVTHYHNQNLFPPFIFLNTIYLYVQALQKEKGLINRAIVSLKANVG